MALDEKYTVYKTEKRVKEENGEKAVYIVTIHEEWTKKTLDSIVAQMTSTTNNTQTVLDNLSSEYDEIEALLND